MATRLIPREYQQYVGRDKTYLNFLQNKLLPKWLIKNLNFWFLFFLIIFGLSLIVDFLFWGYFHYLDQKYQRAQDKIQALESQRDLDLEKEIAEVNKRMKLLEKFFQNHIYPSVFFRILEEITIPEVRFSEFNGDFVKGQVFLRGNTDSYSLLAKQLAIFKEDTRFKKVEVSNIRLGIEEGGVSFNLNIGFEPSILMKK